MKKIILGVISSSLGYLIAVFMLSIPLTVATSGACSSHEGVNCAAGADWDNSVICNDGWRDSSVTYWEHTACDEYLCEGQTVLLEALIMASDWSLGISDLCEELGLTGMETLFDCLDLREQEMEWQYQSILDTVNDYRYTCYYDADTSLTCGENQYAGSDGYCYCSDGYLNYAEYGGCISYDEVCEIIEGREDVYGVYESGVGLNCYWCADGYTYDSTKQDCVSNSSDEGNDDSSNECGYGEFLYDGQCFKPLDYCEYLYGDNVFGSYGSSTDEITCKCKAYYSWDEDGTACVPNPSEESTPNYCFSDIDESTPYLTAITYVNEQGIVEGYGDGTYKPDEPINRAEFTKILISSKYANYTYEGRYSSCLTDIGAGLWYSNYVCFAEENGIISGYPDGSFKPSQPINIAEALKVTLETYFDSIPDVDGEWYQKYWDYADDNDYLVEGWDDPSDNLTRGEMAELIYRIKN
ncbi:MAG: S-layer homology domain-containing protein [Candidatus Omnitrophica bacterium]|nr:S-layer homology domain-containing protein [Candidatus Omnitrophota bacterium]